MSDLCVRENLKKYGDTGSCPVRNTISRFSGKWGILVLCVIEDAPSIRFNAIGRVIPDISPKALAATLRTLEADGLVRREVFPEVPPRVEYRLTDKGLSLMPILRSLVAWALANGSERGREKSV